MNKTTNTTNEVEYDDLDKFAIELRAAWYGHKADLAQEFEATTVETRDSWRRVAMCARSFGATA